MVTISITAARWSASKRVEALAIVDYRSPRNATRSRNGNRPLGTPCAQQYQRSLYIVEKYFQCATIPSLTMRVIRLAVVASQTCELAQKIR